MIGVCMNCGTIVRLPKLRCEECSICPREQGYDMLVRITERQRDEIVAQPLPKRKQYAMTKAAIHRNYR